jgi:hypothetical protein
MVTANNFDKSSTGTNIEVSVFRGSDTSQRDFDDNIKMLQHSGYSTSAVGYYIDSGNVPDDDSIKFIVKGKKADILKLVLTEGRYYSEAEVKALKKADLQEAALEALDNGEKVTLLNFDYLNKYLARDYPALELVTDKPIESVDIHGYRQGDYAKVWYCPADLQAAWGNAPDKEKLKEEFTHYFYDAPIYAVVTINGTEYNYWDQPEYDSYDWDGDKFAEYVAKESGVPVKEIKALLPDQPDYV